MTCLTNQGDLVIHSLPELRRQVLQTQCMKKENVIGITSLVFTPWGEAFYPSSASELTRISMAAAVNLQPIGSLSPVGRHDISSKKESISAPPPPAMSSAVKKTSASAEDAEAAAVARQNQINEQQAQGN